MSTRSSITVRKDESIRLSVYCHSDGYPSHNGELLLKHYNTLEKALELVSLGHMSQLGERIHPEGKHGFEYNEREEGVTVYYGRDRNERDTDPIKLRNVDSVRSKNDQEYNYYFDGKEWFVQSGDYNETILKQVKLTPEICEKF